MGSRFTKSRWGMGGGVYTCRSCKKRTRDTGDNGALGLCPLCEARSSWGNHLSDNGLGDWDDLKDCKTVAEVERKVDELTKAKGK
jgi:hypothetical protein